MRSAGTVDADRTSDPAPTLTAHRLLDLLYRRDVALAHHRHQLARRLRVTETEVLALIHLVRQGEMAPSDLGQLLDLSSGGATALVQRLVAAGRVTRHPNPHDRRGTLLRVTPGAADAVTDAEAPLRAGLDALAAGLRGEEQATVAAFLSELAELHEELDATERAEGAQTTGALERPVPSLWA